MILIGESSIDIQGLLLKNISTSDFMMSFDSYSYVSITNSEITDTRGSLVYVSSSAFYSDNLYIHNIIHTSSLHPVIGFLKSEIEINNLKMKKLVSGSLTKEYLTLD